MENSKTKIKTPLSLEEKKTEVLKGYCGDKKAE